MRRVRELLDAIRGTSVAVLGDFCVDAYWMLDLSASETSVETGLATRPVREQRYSLGGAGNVVSNLAALGVGKIFALGVIGDDLFGREMIGLLQNVGADTTSVVVQAEQWDTPVYSKPHVGEDEQERIDFGVFNRIRDATEEALAQHLRRVLGEADCVILNQQLVRGVTSDTMLRRLNDAIASAEADRIFIVDSRDKSEHYAPAVLKLNSHEAARLCGEPKPLDQMVLLDDVKRHVQDIFSRTGKPVIVTRGDRGCIVCDGEALHEVPGIQIIGRVDPVGAGDTFVSALAGALAAGAVPHEAAQLANFAAAVTVQKLRQTGTAPPEEILQIGTSPDYVYRPEVAEDPRSARYFKDTEIEILNPRTDLGHMLDAIFDHDGTISALRQGWEDIMAPMMIRAILGPHYETADEAQYRRVAERVHDYIDKSTGIQTILQMEALVEIVREFGFVHEQDILDRFGYKEIYNSALTALVDRRLAKLARRELDVADFTIKGAVEFLRALHGRGMKLYLASGSDRQDVVREAEALGYASLFEGRIFGAVGDVSQYSKKMVIESILREEKLTGAELACFGDGPVELRETKKRGGIAIGIASDEVRRYGLSPAKRPRLVKAGADLIVPDFSQGGELLDCLFDRSGIG